MIIRYKYKQVLPADSFCKKHNKVAEVISAFLPLSLSLFSMSYSSLSRSDHYFPMPLSKRRILFSQDIVFFFLLLSMTIANKRKADVRIRFGVQTEETTTSSMKTERNSFHEFYPLKWLKRLTKVQMIVYYIPISVTSFVRKSPLSVPYFIN